MLLFIDTETTGIHNAKIVELAALLTDNDGEEMGSMNVLINNVDIPPAVTDIHGITNEMCAEYGVNIEVALDMFLALHSRCNLIIGHNISFDMRMILSALNGRMFDAKGTYCTMLNSVGLCKLPNKNGRGWKWAKLSEAYKVICGKELDGGHRAMVDVRACAEVYFSLRETKKKTLL